jgi:hypothetical protein
MSIQKLVDAYRPYDELRWAVEVVAAGGGGVFWWEPIAAFNSREVAVDYAKRSREAADDNDMNLVYRVRERGDDDSWVVVGSLADDQRRVKDRYGRARA